VTAILTQDQIREQIAQAAEPSQPVAAPACDTGRWQYIHPFADAVDGLVDTLANPDGRLLFGMRDVDVMMRGVGQGELCFVTGRSHSGKTQVVMQAIANHPDKNWIVFTPDEVSELVLMKLACITHGYSAEDVEARIHDPKVVDMLRHTASTVFKNLIVIDEGLDFGKMQIALAEAEEYWGGPADGIVLDYLELVPGGDAGNDGVTWKVQELKRWTKQVHRPVICLHQGKRGERGRAKGIDGMRYGGENEATFVLEVYRKCQDDTLDEYERAAEARTITISLVKNKRPPCKTGTCDLFIDPNFGSIRPLQEGDRYVAGTQPASPSEAIAAVQSHVGWSEPSIPDLEDF